MKSPKYAFVSVVCSSTGPCVLQHSYSSPRSNTRGDAVWCIGTTPIASGKDLAEANEALEYRYGKENVSYEY